jgi:class 3 adenylate cyclase
MEFDLGSVLPAIQARTLIVHRTGNALFDPASARAAATRIPGARLAELPGADDLPYVGDSDALLDVIQEFLTGVPAAPDSDRSLATVLFTDIVGSTQKVGELGDRRWRDLLEEHHARIRRLLERFGGSEVDTAGDGFSSPLTGPHGRFGARAPSGARWPTSVSRSGQGCIPVRSSAGARR